MKPQRGKIRRLLGYMSAWLRLPPGLLLCGLGLMAATLPGCKPAATPDPLAPPRNGVAASLNRTVLMDAVFGREHQMVGKHDLHWRAELPMPAVSGPDTAGAALAALPAPVSASGAHASAASAALPAALPDLHKTLVLVTPREVVRLNDSEAVLVFDALPHDAQERAGRESGAQVWVGAVFFERMVQGKPAASQQDAARPAEQWRIRRFQPALDVLGFEGRIGEQQVYKLAPDQYLLTFTPGYCNAGDCRKWLHGYLLQPHGMGLALRMPLSASNRNAWPDCDRRLQAAAGGKTRPEPHAGSVKTAASAPQGDHACYDVQGELSPISREGASADVSMRFKGVVSGLRGRAQRVQQVQLFRLQQGMFTQVQGGPNPVPEP